MTTHPLSNQVLELSAWHLILTPQRVTFNPPVTIRFPYDPTLIPSGMTASNLQIAYYDNALGAWITLTTTSVDTTNNFIFAQISHFTPVRCDLWS